MPTPQSTATLAEIAELFRGLDDFVLCGHVNPDGDCLGSQLALAHALRALGKNVACVLAKPDPIDLNLRFLPGVEQMIPASEFEGPCRVFVALDVPTVERIGQAAALHDAAEVRFTIDHHAAPLAMAEYSFTEPASPSTTMLVWEVVKMLDAVNAASAQCALAGLMTDTGRFAYQNTNAEALRSAAEMLDAGAEPAMIAREAFQNRSLASMELERVVLERMAFFENGAFVCSYLRQSDFDAFDAIKADAEPLVNCLRSIRGVRVALILRENPDGEVRGSLRAKDDCTDVAQVARSFEGGGHKAAAGFTFHGTIEQALDACPQRVIELCFAGDAPAGEDALNG